MKKSTIRNAVVASFAAATLAGGTLVPVATAHAADAPTSAVCQPGEASVTVPNAGTSSCFAASPSILAKGADAVLGLLVPGLSLGSLNNATAVSLLEGMFQGNATIAGDGLNTAIGAGGTAVSNATGIVSGAISIGSLDGQGLAGATFGGLAVAAGLGDTVTKANALPLGIAVAIGSGADTSATALGGFAVAHGSLPGDGTAMYEPRVVCTALYGNATVNDPTTGDNVKSCTSIGFIFQKSQDGTGPVVYSIKNPFSLAMMAPLDPLIGIIALGEQLGVPLPLPDAVKALLPLKIAPEFTSDLIRVVITDQGSKFETDLFKNFGSAGPSVAAAAAPSTGLSVTPRDEVESTPVGETVVDTEPEATSVETPETDAPVVETGTEAQAAAGTEAAPETAVPDGSEEASAADDAPAADDLPAAGDATLADDTAEVDTTA